MKPIENRSDDGNTKEAWTQAVTQLAKQKGVSETTVLRVLRNSVEEPDAKTLRLFSEIEKEFRKSERKEIKKIIKFLRERVFKVLFNKIITNEIGTFRAIKDIDNVYKKIVKEQIHLPEQIKARDISEEFVKIIDDKGLESFYYVGDHVEIRLTKIVANSSTEGESKFLLEIKFPKNYALVGTKFDFPQMLYKWVDGSYRVAFHDEKRDRFYSGRVCNVNEDFTYLQNYEGNYSEFNQSSESYFKIIDMKLESSGNMKVVDFFKIDFSKLKL